MGAPGRASKSRPGAIDVLARSASNCGAGIAGEELGVGVLGGEDGRVGVVGVATGAMLADIGVGARFLRGRAEAVAAGHARFDGRCFPPVPVADIDEGQAGNVGPEQQASSWGVGPSPFRDFGEEVGDRVNAARLSCWHFAPPALRSRRCSANHVLGTSSSTTVPLAKCFTFESCQCSVTPRPSRRCVPWPSTNG